eukprot:GHVS01032336.1.p1 GENE.GHVS01032336.1~~GHVS01032336.1.p1  ORF type:complete len:560 (-),score=144.87 GHVS01032336.1:118-1797(-)
MESQGEGGDEENKHVFIVPQGIDASATTDTDNVTISVQPLPTVGGGGGAFPPAAFSFQSLFSPPPNSPIQHGAAGGGARFGPFSGMVPPTAVVPQPLGVGGGGGGGWGGDVSGGGAAVVVVGSGDEQSATLTSSTLVSEEAAAAADALEATQSQGIAHPPPQVMTALGPMPLPADIRAKIPTKFVANPIIEEREIYVAKKEVEERTIEIPHVEYEHKFEEVTRKFIVEKLVPMRSEIIREIPREIYKPVVEEKVIEVAQGVKYVEVPVEVPCLYPPKIVPVPKIQYVERVIETIKPIVKQKIVEVPQTVIKEVIKEKIIEVPYYVPRYVEKIIEVPYRVPEGQSGLPPSVQSLAASMNGLSPQQLPPYGTSSSSSLPFSLPGVTTGPGAPGPGKFPFSPPPLGPGGVSVSVLNIPGPPPPVQGFAPFPFGSQPATAAATGGGGGGGGGMGSIAIGPDGFPEGWEQMCAESSGGGGGGFCSGVSTCLGGGGGGPPAPKPLVVTCPPEVGDVKFGLYQKEPDILTRTGVTTYKQFQSGGNVAQLFPPLPQVDPRTHTFNRR